MKKIALVLVSFLIVYLLASFVLLNGKLTYWTSSNPGAIQDSKYKKVFVTDEVEIVTEGDSLHNWNTKFNIWTNKRLEIKYFGFLVYWTFEDPNCRYLNIEPKMDYIGNTYFRKRIKINDFERDYMEGFTGGYENCCNRISCEVGDTVAIEFMESKNNGIMGEIKVVIK